LTTKDPGWRSRNQNEKPDFTTKDTCLPGNRQAKSTKFKEQKSETFVAFVSFVVKVPKVEKAEMG